MIVEEKRGGIRPQTLLALSMAIALIALAVYHWNSSRSLPPLSGTLQEMSSQDWARIELPAIGCSVVNNVWNKAAAGGGFEQQIFSESCDGNTVYGWRWHAPWHLISRVVSQPQLVCGDKPWDAPLHLNSQFPFRAGSKKLTASFDTRLKATGTYNMAFSLWAVSSLPASRNVITHEIMIWNANSAQSPGGTKRDMLIVDGVVYDVYVEENHADNSGQNSNRWMYVAFVPSRPLLRGRLDISSFIDYMLQKKMITDTHYLTSLEFGNEVSEGSGIVEIRDFSLLFH
jgi:Glycosyl hydrolase family 12